MTFSILQPRKILSCTAAATFLQMVVPWTFSICSPAQAESSLAVPNRQRFKRSYCEDGIATDAKLSALAEASVLQNLLPGFNLNRAVTVRFTLDNDGIPAKVDVEPPVTGKNRFYCEQAVWDSAPFGREAFAGRTVSIELQGQSSEPSQAGKGGEPGSVYMRSVPASVARQFPGVMSKAEIDKDLVALRSDRLSDPRVNELRRDWAAFIAANVDVVLLPEDIRQQSVRLRTKYAELFDEKK